MPVDTKKSKSSFLQLKQSKLPGANRCIVFPIYENVLSPVSNKKFQPTRQRESMRILPCLKNAVTSSKSKSFNTKTWLNDSHTFQILHFGREMVGKS